MLPSRRPTGLPLHATRSPSSMTVPIRVVAVPLTVMRPAAMSSSTFRREPSPHSAKYLLSRVPTGGAGLLVLRVLYLGLGARFDGYLGEMELEIFPVFCERVIV